MAENQDVENVDPNNASTTEENDGSILTLNDVIEMEEQIIEDTAAVLGAVSDKACSYNEGYTKRQALYSCLTCIPEAKTDASKAAGVCLACSYHCHDGHDLIELYTKRNFRCDCGNSKFSNFKCNLQPDKDKINELNSYNQNFSGSYCVCHRPYPDPEDPVPDEMIQCIICEDWYHGRHLGIPVPSNNYAEMTCENCIRKHEFLLFYHSLYLDLDQAYEADKEIDVEGDQPEGNPGKCTKPTEKVGKISAKFWKSSNWRKKLCGCAECLKMYETEGVAYLLDPEDPVLRYEEIGKAKAKEVVENCDKKFMNSMDRVQLNEAIAGYNDLKANLAEYLKKFAESKKVIREEDIKEFFEGMNARKKQRMESVPPHFCR